MENFFARSEVATWTRPEGRLHVYVLPNEELGAVMERYQEQLGPDSIGNYGLGMQPRAFFHFTVQMLSAYRPEVTDDRLPDVVDTLTEQVGQVEPFELRVGPPLVSQHAVEMWVEPDKSAEFPQWRALVERTRTAVASALGEEAVPPLGPNATPHTSMGYGVAAGDSGVITSRLKELRLPMVTVPVREVHLLAVTQHPERGCFTWDPLAVIPLNGGA